MSMDNYPEFEEQEFEGEEIEVEALGVEVSIQPIELYKVLKIANVVGGGGEAKNLIADGYVAVNGQVEQRKRCKIYDGDVIEFNQDYFVVICPVSIEESEELLEQHALDMHAQAEEREKTQQAKKKANKSKKNTSNSKNRSQTKNKQQKTDKSKKTASQTSKPEQKKEHAQSDNDGRKSISFF
ncbi:RNA-binding S4 domain-containing protein [Vibrio sp. SS-MA-C1-2]|uniref:RNA-binding S4 domain-containing protein n=1 Tax=Vibrio sp. SS-MA-C1-2 TaxID=2908646 RepID=UPI001F228410|nr:RNA-binding S4 domain-containing protein [Vibrio sp. SS-MA-C1-2]UJF17395.1 RNA-binding S4 domain-containing protein [Vibrio sp. SS-MA-C1-2]